MFKATIPVLHVASSAAAEEFYCKQLGFRRRFAYRAEDSKPDPCFMGLTRDDVCLHVSSYAPEAASDGVVYLLVENVDALQKELLANGVQVDLQPIDQTTGNREMCVKDPDGNSIRFVFSNGDKLNNSLWM